VASGDDTLPSSAEDAPPPPLQLGRYQILGQLGAGGAGIVLAALDPTLHRKVALKVLRPQTANVGDHDTRLRFEAQAMAQLAHPNVVTVFEVGRVGEQVYVAMELVEGGNLRGWMKAAHTWREVVEIFIAAGRGLVAAHSAGLIHRDFKPDNVMLGRDGRPRVTDFGLVIQDATGELKPDSQDPVTSSSFHGGVVGTPAYMSAEQWAGGAVDARSDQFAFCVSLWEVLFGRRPFTGERVADLRDAVRRGAIGEPGDRRVPRWLVAALRRGLASDPAARWPTMAALLARLERGLHRRRSTVVAVAAVALAALAIGFAVAEARRVPDPCAPPTERVAAVWSPARGARLRLHLALIDPVEGAARFARIASALDTGTRGWSAMHVDACRATRVEGRQSDTLLDRRMACLDRWLGELATTVTALEQVADRGAVDQAVHAANALSPLEACADQRALTDAPLPASAADRATAAALDRAIAEVEVAIRAARLDGVAARASALVAAARTLGHPPTLSAALAAQARVLYALGDEAQTLPILRELVLVAARAHADRDEAFAWTNLMMVVAENEGKLDEALALVPSASAAVLRAGDPADLRADLLYYQGTVLDGGPHPELGRARLAEARALLEKAGAGGPGSPLTGRLADVLFETGTSYIRTGEVDAAAASYRAAIERWRIAYGNDTVDEAFGWHNLGATYVRAGKLDDARAAYDQAIRIRQARLGDSAMLATSVVGLASVFDEEGQWQRSLETYDRALRIYRATLAPGDLHFGNPLIGRAIALGNLDRLDDAARGYDEAIGLFEHAGGETINFAIALANRAHLARRRGHCDDTLRDAGRAVAMMEKLVEPTSRWLIYPLVEQASCLIDGGRAADAIPLVERALRCKADESIAVDVARARAQLGRALVESGRDRGGVAMVRAARPLIAGRPENADEVRALDRWLAAHPR
jgi:tetratricopeptide (TPR) repeat protein